MANLSPPPPPPSPPPGPQKWVATSGVYVKTKTDEEFLELASQVNISQICSTSSGAWLPKGVTRWLTRFLTVIGTKRLNLNLSKGKGPIFSNLYLFIFRIKAFFLGFIEGFINSVNS